MAAVQPLDNGFPKLAESLDPKMAASAIALDLREAGFGCPTLNVEVERIRLKPGRKALIGYRLTGRDSTDQAIDQRMMLTHWPDGEARKLPLMHGNESSTPNFGPSTMAFPRLQANAWFFPNDRKIGHIADLIAQGREKGEVEIVHYVPEQGCTIRVDAKDGILYGKARADDRGSVAASITALPTGAPPSMRLRLAPIDSYDAARRILWQRAVNGSPVSVSDLTIHAGDWSARIASAIAAFHQIPVQTDLKSLTAETIAATIDGRIARTATAMPDVADRLVHLARRIRTLRPSETPLQLAHCDLHPSNLLWDGSSFAIIDLDTAALAPAALDHGTLVASIAHRALVAGASPKRVADMIKHFRAAAAPELNDPVHFDWFVAASLLGERLYRCGTRLKSPEFRIRTALINLAEGCLDNMETRNGQ
jgi:hypothetical protein